MKLLAKRLGIHQVKTTSFRPQTNGSLEHSHHTLAEYLKQFISKDESWDEFIELACFSYNCSVHESTQKTPFSLFGKEAVLPSSQSLAEIDGVRTYDDYLVQLISRLHHLRQAGRQNLIRSKEENKVYYDKRINVKTFYPGEYVFLLKESGKQKKKFRDQYTGPHKVLEILNHKNIKILIKNKTKIVCTDKVRHSYIRLPENIEN